MAVREYDGYDTILHKISRYDTIGYNTVPKRCAVCQQSKINVAFSLTFKRHRRRSNVNALVRSPLKTSL